MKEDEIEHWKKEHRRNKEERKEKESWKKHLNKWGENNTKEKHEWAKNSKSK